MRPERVPAPPTPASSGEQMSRKFSYRRSSSFFLVALATAATVIAALTGPARAAPAPSGLDNTRQLYVNGVRAQRASGTVPVTLTKTATGYTASAPTLAGWRNPSDLEFVYTAGEALWNVVRDGLGQWTEPRCPIA